MVIPDPWTEALLDIALSPALWLGVGIAVVCAVIFVIIFGGGLRQLGPAVLASLIGFAAGQLAGSVLDAVLLQVGQLQVLWGTAGSVAALLLRRLTWPRESAR